MEQHVKIFFMFWLNKRCLFAILLKSICPEGRAVLQLLWKLYTWVTEREHNPERLKEIKRRMHRDLADLCICLFVLMLYLWIQKGSKALQQHHSHHRHLTYTYCTHIPQTSRVLISLSFTDSDCATFEKSEWVCWLETALTCKSSREIDSGFGSRLSIRIYSGKPETTSDF